jgi:hypothetical protein
MRLPPGRLLHRGGRQAFQPDARPRPLGGAAAGNSNCGSVTSSATVAVLTVPSSSAIRTRVPAMPMTTFGLPPTKTRSPTPTRRRPPLTRSRPGARQTACPAAP